MNHSDGFIQNERGQYRTQRWLTSDEIIQAATALSLKRLHTVKDMLTAPHEAAQFLQLALGSETHEQFAVLFLNSKHRLISFERLFRGTIDATYVHPRIVVQKALELNAAAVILAHNHPSGDCYPSDADQAITQRLKDALGLVDIRVLDHLIVSSTEWHSMAEIGWL